MRRRLVLMIALVVGAAALVLAQAGAGKSAAPKGAGQPGAALPVPPACVLLVNVDSTGSGSSYSPRPVPCWPGQTMNVIVWAVDKGKHVVEISGFKHKGDGKENPFKLPKLSIAAEGLLTVDSIQMRATKDFVRGTACKNSNKPCEGEYEFIVTIDGTTVPHPLTVPDLDITPPPDPITKKK